MGMGSRTGTDVGGAIGCDGSGGQSTGLSVALDGDGDGIAYAVMMHGLMQMKL